MIQFTPDTPLAPVEKKTLIIAMTPRSGSTNLCSALAKLKTFGDPQEYFNPRGPMEHFSTKVTKTSTPKDYLAAIAERADFFSFKIASVDWQPFAKRARTVFPNARYIYLDRVDIDAQAISLYRAKASEQWHSRVNDKKPAPPAPPFDATGIESCRQELFAEKLRWSNFFFEAGIKPLNITYEHLAGDMPRALQRICSEAGVGISEEDAPTGDYRILRDDVTERWKKKLRKLRLDVGSDGGEDA